MKKFGTIVLTVYLTLATLGATLFGFLYFSNKIEENKMSQEEATSLVTTVWRDLKNCVSNVVGTSTMVNVISLEYDDYNEDNFDETSLGGINTALYFFEIYKDFISTHTADRIYVDSENNLEKTVELMESGAAYHQYSTDEYSGTSIFVTGNEDNWKLDMCRKDSRYQSVDDTTSAPLFFQTVWHYEKKNGKVFKAIYAFLEMYNIEAAALQDGRYDLTKEVKGISELKKHAVAILDYDLNAHQKLAGGWIGNEYGDDSLTLDAMGLKQLSNSEAIEVANYIINTTKKVKMY